MVEDQDWYKQDQALHWSFVDGSIFKDPIFRKQFKKEKEPLDLSLAGVDPKKMRRRCGIVKVPGEYEMEVEAELRPVEDKDEDDSDEEEDEEEEEVDEEEEGDDDEEEEQKFGHVASWTCEQLVRYLREQGLPESVLKKLEEKKVTGKRSLNLEIEEADEIFPDKSLMAQYDQTV